MIHKVSDDKALIIGNLSGVPCGCDCGEMVALEFVSGVFTAISDIVGFILRPSFRFLSDCLSLETGASPLSPTGTLTTCFVTTVLKLDCLPATLTLSSNPCSMCSATFSDGDSLTCEIYTYKQNINCKH